MRNRSDGPIRGDCGPPISGSDISTMVAGEASAKKVDAGDLVAPPGLGTGEVLAVQPGTEDWSLRTLTMSGVPFGSTRAFASNLSRRHWLTWSERPVADAELGRDRLAADKFGSREPTMPWNEITAT